MRLIKLSPSLRWVLMAGAASAVLASCSGGSDGDTYTPPPTTGTPTPNPTPSPTPGPTPSPTPTPTPTPTGVTPTQAASQLGSGFYAAFVAQPTAEPRNPLSTDVDAIDPAGDPIDITNP